MKNSFLGLFSMKVLYIYVQCKSSQSIIYIFCCFSNHHTKSNWKDLKFVLKNKNESSKNCFYQKFVNHVFRFKTRDYLGTFSKIVLKKQLLRTVFKNNSLMIYWIKFYMGIWNVCNLFSMFPNIFKNIYIVLYFQLFFIFVPIFLKTNLRKQVKTTKIYSQKIPCYSVFCFLVTKDVFLFFCSQKKKKKGFYFYFVNHVF